MDVRIVGQIFLIRGDRFLNVLPARLHIVLDGFVMPLPYRKYARLSEAEAAIELEKSRIRRY